jgi:hypothetical protein
MVLAMMATMKIQVSTSRLHSSALTRGLFTQLPLLRLRDSHQPAMNANRPAPVNMPSKNRSVPSKVISPREEAQAHRVAGIHPSQLPEGLPGPF